MMGMDASQVVTREALSLATGASLERHHLSGCLSAFYHELNEFMEIDNIYNMDCLEGMKQIPDGTIDLIVTDPPYEFVGNNEKYGGRGAFGSVGRAYHSELEQAGIIGGFQREAIMKECIRVMKKVNNLYMVQQGANTLVSRLLQGLQHGIARMAQDKPDSDMLQQVSIRHRVFAILQAKGR